MKHFGDVQDVETIFASCGKEESICHLNNKSGQ